MIHLIVFVPCGILVPTPCDTLPNSFTNDFVHIYFSCTGTCLLNNCVYPHGFHVYGCNTWFMYSSSSFIKKFINAYLWRNYWWCLIAAAYPNRLEFPVGYLCYTSCTLNSRYSTGMMYGILFSYKCVREYLVLLYGFILLDGFSCGITSVVLFLLLLFTRVDDMVCSIFSPPPLEVVFPPSEVV